MVKSHENSMNNAISAIKREGRSRGRPKACPGPPRGSPREPGEGRGGGCPKPYTRPGTSLSSSFCVFLGQPGSQPPCLGSPGRPGKPREPGAAWPAWGGLGSRERARGGPGQAFGRPLDRPSFFIAEIALFIECSWAFTTSGNPPSEPYNIAKNTRILVAVCENR